MGYFEMSDYSFFPTDRELLIKQIGKEALLKYLEQLLLIRNFELRAEGSYFQGMIGGFFHSSVGQEAIAVSAVGSIGPHSSWWATSYRSHALALSLGATPNEVMAELYGRLNGNALGRGGSMHLYTDKLLGGFGIVAGQIPIATGAAFSTKYLGEKRVALCFMGDGAVAQGVFHESLNMAALWDLPCIYVIENNSWGMGTPVNKAISLLPIATTKAAAYGINGYLVDGMDFFNCYGTFSYLCEEVLRTSRPVLVEAITERFKGHSISDPALYRSKEELARVLKRDPITLFAKELIDHQIIDQKSYELMDATQKELVLAAVRHAQESPSPDPFTLEEGVFAI